jgi:DNA-binding Xre family transcriptional regulator
MKDLIEIVHLLQDRNITRIAAATGLSYMTVWRIARGKTGNITFDTLKRLNDYFDGE